MKVKCLKSQVIVTIVLILAAALLYLSPISCPILYFTGVRCPGCGMTRAVIAVLRLDFKSAFSYHFMVWSLPVLYLCFLFDGKLFSKKCWNLVLYCILGAGFLINWIMHLAAGEFC